MLGIQMPSKVKKEKVCVSVFMSNESKFKFYKLWRLGFCFSQETRRRGKYFHCIFYIYWYWGRGLKCLPHYWKSVILYFCYSFDCRSVKIQMEWTVKRLNRPQQPSWEKWITQGLLRLWKRTRLVKIHHVLMSVKIVNWRSFQLFQVSKLSSCI